MGRSVASALIASMLIAALLVIDSTPTDAQTLYKYRGEDGEWIYTDRKPPADREAETRQLETSFVQPEFSISHEVIGTAIEFVAHNDFFAPVEVELEFTDIQDVEYPHPDQILRWVVEPRSNLRLLELEFLEDYSAPYVEFQFKYLHGDPTIRHQAPDGYRVPYAAGLTFPISQAYPDSVTHRTIDSIYAVDLAMPIGTDVVAARAGIVFDVAADNYRGGLDLSRDGQAANIVRILHDDGTFALYAHLNWNSIRVKPGDRVRQGEYIADSGNTGYSSGPHLHFSVQKNAGLRIESLPVSFRGSNSARVVPASGVQLTAYQ